MTTTGKTHTVALTLALLFATCSSAQTPVPVPSNFATAKTAFLASEGAPDLATKEKEGISILYSSMYKALLAASIYKLETNPAAADLSMSVSIGNISMDFNGNSLANPFIRLSIRDTKTQSLLWNIDETLKGAWREKTFEKNVDTCTAQIIADLKQLAAGTSPSNTPAPNKGIASQPQQQPQEKP
jgi:hypothetical protein